MNEHNSNKLQDLQNGMVKIKSMISKLNQKESDLANFFNISPDLCSIVSSDGYYKIVNDAWTAVTGFTADEMIEKPCIDFLHPDDVGKTLHNQASQELDTIQYNWINRHVCKNGHYVTLSWASIKKEDGTICASARPLNNYEIMFDLSEDMLVTSHVDGNFIFLNKKWEKYIGYTSTDIKGLKWYDLIHPDDLNDTLNVIKYLDVNSTLKICNRYRHKLGHYVDLIWNSKRIDDVIYSCAKLDE
ncbi:MAG: PAS domain S-box protein [Nanoarchaeota archaeon]